MYLDLTKLITDFIGTGAITATSKHTGILCHFPWSISKQKSAWNNNGFIKDCMHYNQFKMVYRDKSTQQSER